MQDIALRNKYKLNLITIKRAYEFKEGDELTTEEHILGVPESDTVIKATDTIIVFGTSKDIKRFIEINS